MHKCTCQCTTTTTTSTSTSTTTTTTTSIIVVVVLSTGPGQHVRSVIVWNYRPNVLHNAQLHWSLLLPSLAMHKTMRLYLTVYKTSKDDVLCLNLHASTVQMYFRKKPFLSP